MPYSVCVKVNVGFKLVKFYLTTSHVVFSLICLFYLMRRLQMFLSETLWISPDL